MTLVKDLPQECFKVEICGIDTETFNAINPSDPQGALKYREGAKPVLFQFYARETGPYLVRLGKELPKNIASLLESDIPKVIHHAPFDLSMIRWNFGQAEEFDIRSLRKAFSSFSFRNILCTKVAAKILDRGHSQHASHSLAGLVTDYLGVRLDKSMDVITSDWMAPELSEVQINYAVKDVQYLISLWEAMSEELDLTGKRNEFDTAMKYMPYHLELECAPIDLRGMFGYEGRKT